MHEPLTFNEPCIRVLAANDNIKEYITIKVNNKMY